MPKNNDPIRPDALAMRTQGIETQNGNGHSKQFLRSNIPFTKFAYWEYRSKGNHVVLSTQAARLLNVSFLQLKLVNFLDLFHPGDKELVKQMITRASERNLPFQIEVRVFSEEDQLIWINIKGSVRGIGSETGFDLDGTMEEITARKQVEREQYRRNQVLEALSKGASQTYILSIITRMIEDGYLHKASALWQFNFEGKVLPLVQGIGLGNTYLSWAEQHNFPLENLGKTNKEQVFLSLDEVPIDEDMKRELRSQGKYGLALFPIRPLNKDFEGVFIVYIQKEGLKSIGEMYQLRTIRNLAEMVIVQKQAEAELTYRRDFEKIVTNISSTFVRVPAAETDAYISDALGKIGEFAKVDRSYIFRYYPDREILSNTHEWCNEGIEPQIQHLAALKLDDFPWGVETAKSKMVISDVEGLPDEAAATRDLFMMQGIKSIIILPMYVGDDWIGFLGFDSVFNKRKWTEEDQSLLQFIGEIIANGLKRKETYEQIRNTNVILERKVEERTAELVHSNKSLERFAFMASHDMKEPLRMVISYLQLLKLRTRDSMDAGNMEYLDFALDGGQRMSNLLEAILAYSRVNMTDRPMTRISLHQVIQNVARNLMVLLQEKNGHVDVYKLPDLDADEAQMEQLFQNLISNGLKFQSGDRQPHITVGYKDVGDAYEFFVKDNGIGIAEEYQDYIFEVFKRLHARNEYKGSGVGLSICKEIVRRHGGEIWLESKLGEGTTFFFTLRKKHEPLEPIKPKTELEPQRELSA
ncbi:MAG: ATP-binding protein [Bacteroidota bacterium]